MNDLQILQDVNRKLFGGRWGKPKSIPYLLMRLHEVLYVYRNVLISGSAGSYLGCGAVTPYEITNYVRILCKLLLKAVSQNDTELTFEFWLSKGRTSKLDEPKLFLLQSWWEVFRKAVQDSEANTIQLPHEEGYLSYPAIKFE
jgi:hypothetical protein